VAVQLSTELNPYSTASPYFGALPTWLTKADANRLLSYQLYEQIYKNVPETFELVQRGTDVNPIYIPAGKKIIETVNRFLAKNWRYVIDTSAGTPADQQIVKMGLQILFAREKVFSKFAMNKRWGLVRGDSLFHVVADPTKPIGRKLSIYDVDPGMYFPIFDIANLDRILGCHLVEQIFNDKGEIIIKRQTYRKEDNGKISSELAFFETTGWDDREGGELKPTAPPSDQAAVAPFELPEQITALPVYHTRNQTEPGNPFGISELSGLEIIMAGVNQSITDEALALALEGLGLYWTTSSPPVDETTGEETTWRLGPGRVVELDQEAQWGRVQGVSSVGPSLDHIRFLLQQMDQTVGVSDVAAGRVDVSIAESGIALALDMAPLIARCEEKEQEILAVGDHMLWDIVHGWFPAFEGMNPGDVQVASATSDPMPVNRAQVIQEVTQLVAAAIIDTETARQILADKLGYEFPTEVGESVLQEQQRFSEARAYDPFAQRVAEELELAEGTGTSSGAAPPAA
jgi:hypothetical protein